MMPDSPEQRSIRPPHPLALELIDRLGTSRGASVLEFAPGSGRNTTALRHAGLTVTAVDRLDRIAGPYDASLTTHGLLHGTRADIHANVARIASLLKPGAPLYATFGSIDDARFGKGTYLDELTFAPDRGDETGVAHTYFDERRLRELLQDWFALESIEPHHVDAIAGSWAHSTHPLEGSVHWFVRAIRTH